MRSRANSNHLNRSLNRPRHPPPARSLPKNAREKILLPLSQAEIQELSEGVLAEQKKLMRAAPTEWNSGPGFQGKEAKKRKAAQAAAEKGETRRDDGCGEAGEIDEATAVVDQAVVEGRGGRGGAAAVDDDSSLGLLYRLLLAEMHQGSGPLGGLNNRWIDQDALLQVRLVPFKFFFSGCVWVLREHAVRERGAARLSDSQ